jgi:TolB-like protein/class 3 adenylate cyclase/Tfp pilus assembly protein PilF
VPDPERRLAAILSADAVGYSRLMAEDEAGTIRALSTYRDLISGLVANHRGRVVDAPGDNLLAEFPNALDAVQCAVEAQGVLRVRNQSLPEPRRMLFRMGVHLGDITAEGGRVYGDGVNIAARLEGLAEPGGVCISADVHNQVSNKLALAYDDLGDQAVKNIPDPVHAYRVRLEALPHPTAGEARTPRRSWARAAGVAVLVAGLAVVVAYFGREGFVGLEEPKPAEIADRQLPAAEPAARDKSIAVLPFANRSANQEDAFFVDGIHDDVLTHISRISALKVISRTSVMRYRDTTKNLKTIGEELGVATVLEGGIQRAGNQVRVNVQLIDAATDEHLWADTYDRRLTANNIFAIQTEIATAIADALRATLSPEERDQLTTVPTENLAAYQAYLFGKQRLAKLTSDSLVEAGEHFQRAIKLDPNFALAYVGLADACIWGSGGPGFPVEETLAKAQAAAEKALELDDRLGEAYTSLGGIKQERFDARGAEAAYQRALELSPNYAKAYSWYANLLDGQLGRPEEALTLHQKAIELDPLSTEVLAHFGQSLSTLGRSDEALALWNQALEVDPSLALYDVIGDHYWLALGELDQAVVWYAKAMDLDPGDPALPAGLGWLLLDLGAPEDAEVWIERSFERDPESAGPNIGMAYLKLHQNAEDAVDFARGSLENFPNNLPAQWVLRNQALTSGRYAEARALYEEVSPQLLDEEAPKIDTLVDSIRAIDLALVLTKTGEQERVDLLLERSLRHMQTRPRLGFAGYWIDDVRIYALQGEKQKAMAALREAIDEGWRAWWWYFLERDPNLESLHDEPEFQAMVEEIRADMAAQLERVREMQRRGELTPIPSTDASAGSQATHARP